MFKAITGYTTKKKVKSTRLSYLGTIKSFTKLTFTSSDRELSLTFINHKLFWLLLIHYEAKYHCSFVEAHTYMAYVLWKKTLNQTAMSWVLFRVLLRTIVQETASETALRNCSQEVGEEPVYTWYFWLGNTYSQAYIMVKDYC